MHLKQKSYRFGVLLIYTITTITLLSAGWGEPTHSYPTSSNLALHDDRNSVLTTPGLTRPSNEDSRQGEESRNLPYFHYLDNTDGTQTKSSGGKSGGTLGPKMASSFNDRGFETRDKPEQTEREGIYTSLKTPNKDCSKGKIWPVVHGQFYMNGQLEANIPGVGFQSDSAGSGQERIRGQWVNGPEEIWQKLQPVVECGDHSMTLTVRRRRAVQLLLDRVNESSMPLSQLPPQCGYSVQTTWRDLSLMAQYDACHVTQEDDSFVLPLLWRGTPVKLSCPASQGQPLAMGSHSPPSLCCSAYGMTVKVQGLSTEEELRVNVRGEWAPLAVLAEQCGFTLDRQDTEIVIVVPFITCGITVKEGKYTLNLQIGARTFALACPVSPLEELPLTHQPLVNRHHSLTGGPTEHIPESMEPFGLAPPFYLAPPYHPHPTYEHKYPGHNGHDAYNPPTPSSLTPDLTFGPPALPPVDPQQDYQDYYSHQIPVMDSYKLFGVHSSLSSANDMKSSSLVSPDLQQKQETFLLGLSEKRSSTHFPTSDTGFPIPVETPPLEPPSHAFNQYYHYYHHPKIPLPSPPQDPDPGPEVPSITYSHNPEFSALPRSVQHSEAFSRLNPDQFPVPEAASHPYTHPANVPYTPYPPQPFPYPYFYYFPHVARGEAKRTAPINPDKSNLSDHQNTKLSTFDHPLPRSSEAHDEYNSNPHIDQPKSDETITKHPFLSDLKAELDDKKSHSAVQPSLPPTSPPPPNQNLPPYPHYYYPYHYYQMYYGSESLHSADNTASKTSSKEALDPLLEASSSQTKSQATTTPSHTVKSVYDVHDGPLHPYYYYYHLYYQPKVSGDNREVHPSGSMNSKSESQLPSDSDSSWIDWLVHSSEAGYPSMPQSSPFHSLYSHYITQQGEEERVDDEIEDRLKANPYSPSASPCGLGPVSDFHSSVSPGCCSYTVKDCTVGQHLIFVVPDSVLKPTVAAPAHPSEVNNASCTLERLTSDPDIYTVPLDGCGVDKQVFGQTVVHLLEVHGIHSLQQDHSSVHEKSPIRLMVECSSSPGSPGEVRLHVMDQSPPLPLQSTAATTTVQLRIATDEFFTSFHPDTRLPLGMLRGKPVYVEVSLLDPPEPDLVLLIHYCLAYTQAPYTSWMLVYDGCPSRGNSQLLPSPRSHHIQRIMITSFLSQPSESPTYMANKGYSHQEDPEILFLCSTEVCSAADSGCTVGCINSPDSVVSAAK